MKIHSVPWWALLIFFTLLQCMLVRFFTSPCAIIGITDLNKKAVRAAFRKAAVCTHPDHFLDNMEDRKRADILFGRMTNADEKISKSMKSKAKKDKKASCFSYEYSWLLYIYDYAPILTNEMIDSTLKFFEHGFYDLYEIVTFLVFWGFSGFLLFKAITNIQWVVYFLILSPLPTFLRFLQSPFYRVYAFYLICTQRSQRRIKKKQSEQTIKKKESQHSQQTGSKDPPEVKMPENFDISNNKTIGTVKPGTAPQTRRRRSVYDSNGKSFDSSDLYTTMLLHPREKRAEWRAIACNYIQYEMFLCNTKAMFPLITLVYLGFVDRGFLSQIVTATLIRMIPDLPYETVHLWVVVFGYTHTFMGMNANEIEAQATDERMGNVLDLTWEYGFKDAIAISMNILLGGVFSSASGLGNEPLFCTSFAAGVALRLLTFDADFLPSMTSLPFSDSVAFVVNQDSVMTRATSTVGHCGGGPFRAFFGSYSVAASLSLKALLLVLPVLASLQWADKFWNSKYNNDYLKARVNKRQKFSRFSMAICCIILTIYTMYLPFNAIPCASTGFFISCLIASVCESLLATYDTRGGLQKLFTFIFFVLM